DPRSPDLDEGIRSCVADVRGHRSRPAAHRMPLLGPVLMAHQGAQERMSEGLDAEVVTHLALKAARGEGEVAQSGHGRTLAVEAHDQFVALIGRAVCEQVHRAQCIAVVVSRDESQTMSEGEVRGGARVQLARHNLLGVATRPVHGITPWAAWVNSDCRGHESTPSATQATNAVISGTATDAPSDEGCASPTRAPISIWRACRVKAAKMTLRQTSEMATAHHSPASTSARAIVSSLTKRLKGGRATSESSPNPKIPASVGRRANKPEIFAISVVPSRW